MSWLLRLYSTIPTVLQTRLIAFVFFCYFDFNLCVESYIESIYFMILLCCEQREEHTVDIVWNIDKKLQAYIIFDADSDNSFSPMAQYCCVNAMPFISRQTTIVNNVFWPSMTWPLLYSSFYKTFILSWEKASVESFTLLKV